MIDQRARVAALLAIALVGCRGEAGDNDPEPLNTVTNIVEALPAPDPTLDRAALIGAVGQAASAFTTGQPVSPDVVALSGRQFTLRIPFGCTADGNAAMTMTPRADGTAYEARIHPSIALDQIKDAVGSDVESAEGFWLERPWLLDGRCPASAPTADGDEADADSDDPAARRADTDVREARDEPLSPDRTIGIVQLFTATDSRVGHRAGRDYVKVQKLIEGEQLPQGLALVLKGRLQNWPGGTPVRCSGDGNVVRPSCLILSRVDRVEIRRQDTNAVIAEWHR